MTFHHILTVGISLLTNFACERKLTVDDALKQNKAMADYLPKTFKVAVELP